MKSVLLNQKSLKLTCLAILFFANTGWGQTIYSENMGVPNSTSLISAYAIGTPPATFQNSAPIVYTGTADVRLTSASNSYSGASGGGNVWLGATVGKYFQIDGINTSAYATANLKMTFGYLTTNFSVGQVILEYSTNASSGNPTWTPITFTNNFSSAWNLVTIPNGILPSTTTLTLRFSQPTPITGSMRIDDIKVFYYNPTCTLELGVPTGVCNAVTSGIDSYTTTIPYTGGGTGVYIITPSSGTVGGDNPNTIAAGNILINGIAEGTNLTVTIVKDVCINTTTLIATECKPINALPYSESFPYSNGSSLGSQQKWTNVNAGDEIVSVANNLTYSGVASSGNAITFSGVGAECFTPFIATFTGTIFAAFLINVNDMSNVLSDGATTYFASFNDDAKAFKARLFLRKTGTQYQLGLDTNSITSNFDPILRNMGEVVHVVIGYDFTTNTLNAWINPPNSSIYNSAPTLSIFPTIPFTNLGGFMLRQDQVTTTPSIVFDELKIGTSLNDLVYILENIPSPVSQSQSFCNSATIADLTVTGTNIKWYSTLNGGTPLAMETPLITGTYYVSQTINYAESSRTAVTVTITPATTPTFTQVDPVYSGASIEALPTTSTNGIIGTWSPAINNTSTTTYTFTPADLACNNTTTMSIIVNPIITPPTLTPLISIIGSFTGWSGDVDMVTSDGINYTLSAFTFSTGDAKFRQDQSWNYNWGGSSFPSGIGTIGGNNILINAGTYNVYFNRITGEYFFTTTPGPQSPSHQTFCSGATVANLVATGTALKWYYTPTGGVALASTALLASGTYYVAQIFENNTESPRTATNVTVNTSPTFTQVEAVCSGETIEALPTTSINGVTGTWLPVINNTATTTYTFSPTDLACNNPTTMTITVNPITTPTFTQVQAVCSGAILAALPTSSTNGVTGAWFPAINNLETTLYTFTPIDLACNYPTTMSITVNSKTTPMFTPFSPIEYSATLDALPTNSTNGISGSWLPAINNTATTTYTFTPTDIDCNNPTTMTITVNPAPAPIVNQEPQRMAYQSVVRNAANQIVANQNIGVKISIVEGSLTGSTVYSETHSVTTNANGLFSLETGGGIPTTGTFSAINWGSGSHYIKSEMDIIGGTNYTLSGTTELLSVPYALYAVSSGNSQVMPTTKIIKGICSGGTTPNVVNGSGFTLTNTNLGSYYIQFSTPFTTPPTIVACPYIVNDSHIDSKEYISVGSITINGFMVYTKNNDGRANNISFSFIAVSN